MTILYKKMRLDLVMAVVINILRKIFICGTECFIKVRLRASSGRIIITTCMETITAISCARIFALLIPPYPWARKQRTDPNSYNDGPNFMLFNTERNTNNYWGDHQYQTNNQVKGIGFYFRGVFIKQLYLNRVNTLCNVFSTPPRVKYPRHGKQCAKQRNPENHPPISLFKSYRDSNQYRTQYHGKCNDQIRRVRLGGAHFLAPSGQLKGQDTPVSKHFLLPKKTCRLYRHTNLICR